MKLLMTLLFCFLGAATFAQDFVGSTVWASGSAVDKRGYKIRWSSPVIENVLKTGFLYAKEPKITIYLPNGASFKIEAVKATIDPLSKELLFQDVKLMTKAGELKTHFMKLSLDKLHLTSPMTYTFERKNKKLNGQAFYASTTDYKLHLFNTGGGKSKIVDF